MIDCNLDCPVCKRRMMASDDCRTTTPCIHKVSCSCGFSTTAFGVFCDKGLFSFGSADALEQRYKIMEQERVDKGGTQG